LKAAYRSDRCDRYNENIFLLLRSKTAIIRLHSVHENVTSPSKQRGIQMIRQWFGRLLH